MGSVQILFLDASIAFIFSLQALFEQLQVSRVLGCGCLATQRFVAMSSLSDILRELKDVAVLKAKRGETQIVSGLVASIATKVANTLHWDSSSAVAFEEGLEAAALSTELTKTLQDASDARMKETTTTVTRGKKCSGAPPRDQTLKAWYNYFTLKDYAVLDSPLSSEQRRDAQVLERAGRLGIRRASEEHLIKWLMSLLMDVEFKVSGQYQPYIGIYHRARNMVKAISQLPPYTGPFHDKHTDNPQDLPAEILKLVYDPNDPPVQRYIYNFEHLSEHVPLRIHSKLLKRGSGTRLERPQWDDQREIVSARSYAPSYQHHHGSWNQSSWDGPYGGLGCLSLQHAVLGRAGAAHLQYGARTWFAIRWW